MRKTEAQWIESRQRWQIKVQADCQRKMFVSSTPGRKGKIEAEAKADDWLEDHASAEQIRVGKLLDMYVEHVQIASSAGNAKSIRSYVDNHIKPVVGNIKANRLTEGDLQDIIDLAYKKKNLSAKTLKDIRSAITGFLKWARKKGKLSLRIDPLEIPKGAKRSTKRILQPEDIQTLFSSTKTTYRSKEIDDPYIYAYRLYVSTGLRPGELRGIQDRRDIRGGTLSIHDAINIDEQHTQGKNDNAIRTMQLSSYAMQAVEDQRALNRQRGMISRYLFIGRKGGFIRYDDLYDSWRRYCAYNGLPVISLYEMRHTFVSLNKDMPDALKKSLVGHSKDMDTEGVYGHAFKGDLQKAANYVQSALDEVINR